MHQAEISLYPYCRLPIIIEITTIEYIFDISILVVESYNSGPNIFWPSDPKIAAKYYVKSSWKWILLQQRSVARDFVHYSNRWAAVRAPQYLLHFQRFRLDVLQLSSPGTLCRSGVWICIKVLGADSIILGTRKLWRMFPILSRNWISRQLFFIIKMFKTGQFFW